VQRIISLDGGATLKVTVARWYTPKGVNLSEQGIIPDIAVELHAEEMAGGNDTQLTAAFAHLRS
jgi:carboxyl-terminal processing protease